MSNINEHMTAKAEQFQSESTDFNQKAQSTYNQAQQSLAKL